MMCRVRALALRVVVVACALALHGAGAAALEANGPGVLVPGSGTGRVDDTVYAPGMRFPFEELPAFANSQVHGHGGYLGPGGGQCDAENYAFPWWDNFCESRSWETPLCPTGNGHQGQDIRPATCADDTWWAVAAEDGQITSIGSYSVILTTDAGAQYRYLHLSMDRLAVGRGDRVSRGDRIGLVSNDFGGTATTIHLHFEIVQYVASVGGLTHVPPYTSLVDSYEALEVPPEPCPSIGPEGGTVDDADRSCMRFYGPAQYWRTVNDAGYGDGLRWTHAFVAENPSNRARWALEFDAAGTYRLDAANAREWITANGFDQSRELVYRVRHGGEESTVTVDQSSAVGWVPLGAFTFAAGGDQWVEVLDNTGEDGGLERKIVVDAIRVSPGDGPAPECEADTCAARSGCGVWSECRFADACALEGERTRICAEYACGTEGCGLVGSETVETELCSRDAPSVVPGQWVAVGLCEPSGAPCAREGTREERRTLCVDGSVAEESRVTSCVTDTDGLALDPWSAWGACSLVNGQWVEQRERRVCAAGLPADDVESRSCADRSNPRDVPSAKSRSGCAVSGGGRPVLALLFGALVAVGRRRRSSTVGPASESIE